MQLQQLILVRKVKTPNLTSQKISQIKQILNWPWNKPFARCPGKDYAKVKEFEANKDLSHSEKRHICSDCQCTRKSGQGTKGDYYGIGIETGHLGVGLCEKCGKKVPMRQRLNMANQDKDAYQTQGPIENRVVLYEKAEKEQAVEAEVVQKGREDLELVVNTLKDFKDKVADKSLTERMGFATGPASDVTRIKLALDIASTISKLNLDRFKMDSDSYVHYDEFRIRMPQYFNLMKRTLMHLKELVASYKDGDSDPVDVCYADFIDGHKKIWQNIRTGVR